MNRTTRLLKRIRCIIRLQSCTTIAGRRAFVTRGEHRHGIAAGHIRWYVIEAPGWAAVRRMVADVDSTGAKTMGFSRVSKDTVESYSEYQSAETGSSAKPLPLGWRPPNPDGQLYGIKGCTTDSLRASLRESGGL